MPRGGSAARSASGGMAPAREPLLLHHQHSADEEAQQGAGPSPASRAQQVSKVTLTLTNTSIGTSTIAMAAVVKRMGLGLFVGIFALQGVLGVISNHILAQESKQAGVSSYHDLMKERFGRWGSRAAAACQIMNSLGKVVVWSIIIADVVVGGPPGYDGLLPELLDISPDAAAHKWWLARWPWIAVMALLAAPVVCVRSLNKLSGISFVGDVAALLLAGLGITLTVVAGRQGKAHRLHWLPSAETAGVESSARLWLEVLSMFPVLMGAGFTQNQINSVLPQLEPFSQAGLDAASIITRLASMSLFAAIGIGNFVVFGRHVKGDVLMNYTHKALGKLVSQRAALALGTTARGAFLLNGVLTIPMYLYPYQRNLWDVLPNQDAGERMQDRRSFAFTNVLSLAGCAVVAMLVPDVLSPLKLIGGVAVGSMAYIFPGLLLLTPSSSIARCSGGLERSARGAAVRALGWTLVCVGVLQALAGIAAQFVN